MQICRTLTSNSCKINRSGHFGPKIVRCFLKDNLCNILEGKGLPQSSAFINRPIILLLSLWISFFGRFQFRIYFWNYESYRQLLGLLGLGESVHRKDCTYIRQHKPKKFWYISMTSLGFQNKSSMQKPSNYELSV
jgi:hypothetical protein